MGSNYIEMRLEDCMDAIIDYRGKTPKKVDNGIPLITAKIIKNGRIQEVNEFIAINDYDDWMVRGLPLEGDVVLTTEAPLGEVAQLDARKVALAQRVITLRGKKGILENDYLLYLLQSSFVQNQLDGRASGSTVTGIKQSELREIILRLPPVSLQKSISHQLKCLDKKIDLNNKINKTLEQMSQTLFKSWFVDFDPVIDNALDAGNPIPEALQSRAELRQKVRNSTDFKPLPAEIRSLFPSEFEETELGWVPKGWHYKNAEEIATISIGKTPPRTQKECFCDKKDSNYAWVSIKDLGNCSVFIKDSSEYLTSDAVNSYNVKIVPKDAVLLSFKLTIGRIAIAENILTTNEAIAHFYNMKHDVNKEYLYSYLKSFDYNSLGSTSSIATAINSKIIRKIPVLVPDGDILEKYKKSTDIIFQKIKFNNGNICNLTALRDTLLPKLISGELSLDDLPDLTTDTEAA
ncbi:restriction endonuclease subunit S [Escherichia coli]|nr:MULTISPECIES: restriction endonuclease subunit S [Enterobacteriaceae]EFH2637163.1 restriction endonuclease subunit S [Escherichia coli]EFH8034199.1 restriction endonuclease subunit S [Escherichia coli]EFM1286950.1 restriction endonuclease subunit S [Escherichia coli]EGO4605636.1 restriction endonuclease subunit S [Escherichia coli]EHI8839892.1 restriction endonuclease subunit S [Escherichia coli]